MTLVGMPAPKTTSRTNAFTPSHEQKVVLVEVCDEDVLKDDPVAAAEVDTGVGSVIARHRDDFGETVERRPETRQFDHIFRPSPGRKVCYEIDVVRLPVQELVVAVPAGDAIILPPADNRVIVVTAEDNIPGPLPPSRVSSPSAPINVSKPAPPVRTFATPSPTMISLKLVPMAFSISASDWLIPEVAPTANVHMS